MASLHVLGLLASALVAPLDAEPRFVRGGIVLPHGSHNNGIATILHNGQPLPFERRSLTNRHRLLRFAWRPLEKYELRTSDKAGWQLTSPQAPAPLVLHKVPLEDVSQAALAGASPDAIVKFSPQGDRIALGTFGGWLRVIDCKSGQILHQERIAEGIAKQLAWSPDGSRLYVGEQSPDAHLYSLEQHAGAEGKVGYRRSWSLRLADWIESSRPAANDRFGIYSLPCVFDLKVDLETGDLVVSGMHSWSADGPLKNRSVLARVRADGTLAWRLPQGGAWPLVAGHVALDERGQRLLILPSQSQQPTGDEPLRPGTLYLFNAITGDMLHQHSPAPLEPHFSHVAAWDSMALNSAGGRAAVGLVDGRGLLFDTREDELSPLAQFNLGTPIVVGNTPVAASASYTRIFSQTIYFQTQNTHIPFGSPQAALQAPALHRGANTLTAVDFAGRARWRYRGPFALSGVWSSPGSDQTLVVACRERPGSGEPGQFGFLLFDPTRDGGGSDKLLYHYPTAGPVLFNADVSREGVVAVVETPAALPHGRETYGEHQLHLVY